MSVDVNPINPVNEASPSLQAIAARFQYWRQMRLRGRHIPPDLWLAAATLAHEHGAPKIAQAL